MNVGPTRPDLTAGVRLRVRVPLVFVIPLGAILLIALVTVGLSRVLLALPAEAATTVALALALNILGACAVLSTRSRMDTVTAAELLVVVTYPIVIGIVLAQVGFGSGGGHDAQASDGAGPASGSTIVASGVAFETDALTLPADEEATLMLDNQDSVEHNLSIYTDDTATETLFEGRIIDGGTTVDYEIPPLDEGEYFFRCDVHPTAMTGTVTVE